MATGKSGLRIRLTSIPNGIATKQIRAAWVGCTLPVVEEYPQEIQTTLQSVGRRFVVAKESAVNILRGAGKVLAANYWEMHCTSGFFFFEPQHCEEVQS